MRMAGLPLVLLMCLHSAHSLLFPFLPPSSASVHNSGPVVSTRFGRLRGLVLRTASGAAYDAFLGVPYAAPPVGNLRFRAPRPPPTWSGVRDATTEGHICPQPIPNITRILDRMPNTTVPFSVNEIPNIMRAKPFMLKFISQFLTQNENCLFLNVYIPKKRKGALPVLFWIHGGGFFTGDGGSAVYGPDYLIDSGIAVVTINYRLGPLGFMSLGRNSGVPGNAGLKDQVAAMRWVRDNIAAFGGDPNQVTIYGESAGAVCCNLHVISPASAGLFRAAIISSGTVLNHWAVNSRNFVERGRRLAEHLDCHDTDLRALGNCMRRKHNQKIVWGMDVSLTDEDRRYYTGLVPFVPVIEDPDGEEEPFLTESPQDILLSGRFNKVPVIFGSNDAEALLVFSGITRAPSYRELTLPEREVTSLLRDEMIERLDPAEATRIAQSIKKFYFGDQKIKFSNLDILINMGTDLFMAVDWYNTIRIMSSAPAAAPVYMYYFSYDGRLNAAKKLLRINLPGACHSDELFYVFNTRVLPVPIVAEDSPERTLQRRMARLISDFVKTGDPTPSISDLVSVRWEPFNVKESRYLEIGRELELKADFKSEQIKFWDELNNNVIGGPLYGRIKELRDQEVLENNLGDNR